MVDFNTAKYELQISKSQFDRLDILDGEKDNNIADDIFSIAKKIRNNENIENDNRSNDINNILNTGITNWIKPKAGEAKVRESNNISKLGEKIIDYYLKNGSIEGFAATGLLSPFGTHKLYTGEIKQDKEMDENGNIQNDGPYKSISKLGEKIIDYYLKNGSIEGFAATGLLSDYFDIVDIKVDFIYSDGENDTFSIKNGIKQNNKKADGIVVEILTSEGGFKVVKSRVERPIDFGL